MVLRNITKDELINDTHYLTVGGLKKFLNEHNLPDDAKVMIQRVEDYYYEKCNWGVFLKDGEHTYSDNQGNVVIESLEQYHPAWCCVKYHDEDELLFINMHY